MLKAQVGLGPLGNSFLFAFCKDFLLFVVVPFISLFCEILVGCDVTLESKYSMKRSRLSMLNGHFCFLPVITPPSPSLSPSTCSLPSLQGSNEALLPLGPELSTWESG